MKNNQTLPLYLAASVLAMGGLASALAPGSALAADSSSGSAQSSGGNGQAQDMEVDKIKERYWSRGDESDLGVVQNRIYSKEGRVEISGFGGVLNSDPFVSTYNAGASVGYHFTEYLGADVLGWKSFSSQSSAWTTLRNTTGADPNVNEPTGFLGGELEWSVLYGKLSLLGQAIIHYDLHLRAGGGMTYTDNGTWGTGIIGIGQQFYLNQFTTFNVDFRLMPYEENLYQRTGEIGGNPAGTQVGNRLNWSNTITIGLSLLI